jgi:hypothetical protein
MQFITRARVALITAGIMLAVPAAGVAAPHKRSARRAPKLSADYAAWSHVALCEEGGWTVAGYDYPDSLGIDRTNYLRFGGTPQPPGPVSLEKRLLQIRVAERLRARYHVPIPDQGGCGAW